MTDNVAQSDVDAITARIAEANAKRRALASHCSRTMTKLFALRLIASYLIAVCAARRLADKLSVGRGLIVTVFPPAFAAGLFILFDVLTGSRTLSAIAGCVSAVGMFFLVLGILVPRDDHALFDRRCAAESRVARETAEVHDLAQRVVDLDIKIGSDGRRLQEIQARLTHLQRIRSLQYQCECLFNRNWRAMRGGELERYLAEVFALLGYAVEAIGKSGDQGVDLIVAKNGTRIAVQVKGYYNSVNNAAIQQVHAGMIYYKCQRCAVITNSRFTRSAKALADSTGCTLIDESNFRHFVFGTVDLIVCMNSSTTTVSGS
jgi:HJR/Mrr/RecB family endonuclease